MSATSQHRRKRPRNPNWEDDFYRNGRPMEVIVISDDDSSPQTTTTSSSHVNQPPASSNYHSEAVGVRASKRIRKKQEAQLPPPPVTPNTTPLKRRRKGDIHAVGNGVSSAYANNHAGTSYQRQENIYPPYRNERDVAVGYRDEIYPSTNGGYYGAHARELPPCDDKEGHYIVVPEENFTSRYKILKLLGQGTFGKVVECWDNREKTHCAIKIIRAIQKYRDASRIEIKVLNTLKQNDPKNDNRCIHVKEVFEHRNHICMVFELLGQSVFDFLKENEFYPFPPNQIQQFAKQLLTSVAFLHELKLIHTDLKPENILLVEGRYRIAQNPKNPHKSQRILINTDIRLIDFGSATFQDDYHSSVVSTRHYRAPEIILGLGWSYPCDIWSVGCILVEFFTGDALFQTHDNLEHLAMMEVVLGKLPEKIVRVANKHSQKYFRNGRLDYPNEETNRNSRRYVKAMTLLRDMIVPNNDFNREFLDLLQRLLVYDPNERITARDALRHPYFYVQIDEDGREISR